MMSYMFEGDIGDKWDKGNLPEIPQVSPVDHLKYFENHPQIKNPKKTIWINGCFDVLHAGHIEMIKYASFTRPATRRRIRHRRSSSRI
jgi:hypothetical protein